MAEFIFLKFLTVDILRRLAPLVFQQGGGILKLGGVNPTFFPVVPSMLSSEQTEFPLEIIAYVFDLIDD